MKHLFAKWLSALLIAALLLSSAALMEGNADLSAADAAPTETAANDADSTPAQEAVEDTSIESPAAPAGEAPVVPGEESQADNPEAESGVDDGGTVVSDGDEVVEIEAEPEALVFIDAVDSAVSVEDSADWSGEDNVTDDAAYDATSVAIDATNFPDENFRKFISDTIDGQYGEKDGVLTADELSTDNLRIVLTDENGNWQFDSDEGGNG